MLETIITVLKLLNTFSPLGVAALALLVLGAVLYTAFHSNGPIQKIANNHLEHVQDSLDKIAASGERHTELLTDIKVDISFVKGKLS
jgi:F0F1-type ATP synthase membrane subunit b/b'